MEEPGRHQKSSLNKKDIIKGLLGGVGLILFVAAILAGAVLWRASWYFE